LRDLGVEHDSRRTRRAVAYLMAGGDLQPVDLVPQGATDFQYCHTFYTSTMFGGRDQRTKLLAYRTPDGKVAFQFSRFGGYRMLTKSVVYGRDGKTSGPIFNAKDRDSKTVEGGLNSPLDPAAYVKVSWKGSKVSVRGALQKDSGAAEPLICRDL
jgi:hypothetical protein